MPFSFRQPYILLLIPAVAAFYIYMYGRRMGFGSVRRTGIGSAKRTGISNARRTGIGSAKRTECNARLAGI